MVAGITTFAADPQRVRAPPRHVFVDDLQPFSRKLAIPDEIIRSTVKTLIELGDIKPDAVNAKYVDLSYLPR